jgi:putative transposase
VADVPRRKRIQVAGGIYHVFSCATGGGFLFRDGRDRDRHLSILAVTVERYRWRLHFFTLLGTHFHVLLTTPEPNIAAGMQYLNGLYCRSFNRRHGRAGHLVKGRYGSVLVESEQHGAALIPYLALNAVEAGLVRRPEDWIWCSYASLVGLAPGWSFVTPDWILEQFDDDPGRARAYLRALAADQLGGPA